MYAVYTNKILIAFLPTFSCYVLVESNIFGYFIVAYLNSKSLESYWNRVFSGRKLIESTLFPKTTMLFSF